MQRGRRTRADAMDLGKIIQAAAGVHALLGVGWLGLSLYGATLKPPLAPGLRKGQAVLAVLVAFVGLVLWRYKHAGAPGAAEAWLGVGVLLAIAAAGLQHGMA